MTKQEHEKSVEFKITHGYVRQDFVDGKCVGQKFVASDKDGAGHPVEWENEVGDPIDVPKHEYQAFNMVQPGDDVEDMKEQLSRYEAEEYDRQQDGRD